MALRLRGATSGYIELKAPASAGDNTLTLPTNNGSANNFLKTDGSGNLSWSSVFAGTLTTTDSCQVGDLTVLNTTPDLRLQDSDSTGNNTEHTIYFKDSTGANQINIGSPFGEQHLRIKYNTSNLVKIQTDGKVGIGTTSPSFLLDIRKDATAVKAHLGASDGTLATMPNSSEYGLSISGGNVEFGLHKDANGAYKAILGTYQGVTDIPLVFRTASRAERLRIRKDGKLQIGTAGGDSTYLAIAGNAAMDLWGDGSEYPTLRLGTEVYNSVGEDIRFGRSDHGAADIRYHSLKSLHGDSAANNYLEFFLHDFGSSPYTSQKSAFKINGLGNAIIPDGDLVIGTAGHGIDFSAQTGTSATGASTAGAPGEILDHYEEGTWTPVLASTGTAFTSVTNWSSASQNRYTKIGRIVTVQCYHRTGGVDKGSAASTDGIAITGLPFTPTNNVQRTMVPIGQNVNWAEYPNHALVRENIASVELYKSASSGGNNTGSPLTVADVGTAANNNYAIFTLVYESA